MDIKIREEYLEQAKELHRQIPVVDAHLDLAGEILLRYQAGEREVIRHHYLEHFKTAGIKLVLSSIYVENSNLDIALENALEQIKILKEDAAGISEIIFVYSKEDIEKLLSEDKIGILIYMEGLDCIGRDVELIKHLCELGVRGASLTWSRPNELGFGCCKALERMQIPGGLTETGVCAVKRLEELSMFLDISHLNDDGFEDICRITERSFVATHSGSRAVYDNFRNLTDEQMHKLANQGGIMGMNGCKYIAGSESGNHLEMLCKHIEYEVQTIGADHVGYGFDLCDSYDRARAKLQGREYTDQDDCLLHHGQIPLVTAALLQKGMRKEDVCKVIGGNFINYFSKILPVQHQ